MTTMINGIKKARDIIPGLEEGPVQIPLPGCVEMRRQYCLYGFESKRRNGRWNMCRLEADVAESLVGFCHSVHVFLLLEC